MGPEKNAVKKETTNFENHKLRCSLSFCCACEVRQHVKKGLDGCPLIRYQCSCTKCEHSLISEIFGDFWLIGQLSVNFSHSTSQLKSDISQLTVTVLTRSHLYQLKPSCKACLLIKRTLDHFNHKQQKMTRKKLIF